MIHIFERKLLILRWERYNTVSEFYRVIGGFKDVIQIR